METASVSVYAGVWFSEVLLLRNGSHGDDNHIGMKEEVVASFQNAARMVIFSLLIQQMISAYFMAGTVLAQFFF